MKTVLLWGNRWWLGDAPEPLPFAGLVEAADVLAAHFGNRKPRLRLIYQPDSLATVATPCPKGGRTTLAAALAGGFPALGTANHAWSHEPILARGDGFTTLLHFEREPGLGALVARLAARRFAVESVWPLPTFLHALPEEWSDSGAVTVVAVQPDRVCAYRHAADGERSAPAWSGETALAEFGAWLAAILAQNPEEPVLLVGDPETAAALDTPVRLDERPHVTWLSLPEALARRVVLPRRHPAQLLAPMPVITAQRAVLAASFVFLALAAWSGTAYARDVLAWRLAGAAREAQKQALRTEVAHLRGNAIEIARLRESLARVAVRPPAGALLQKISATVPPEVACDSVAVTTEGFTLIGHIAPTAPANAGEAWRARLTDPAWTLDLKPAPARGGAFTVSGVFPR